MRFRVVFGSASTAVEMEALATVYLDGLYSQQCGRSVSYLPLPCEQVSPVLHFHSMVNITSHSCQRISGWVPFDKVPSVRRLVVYRDGEEP